MSTNNYNVGAVHFFAWRVPAAGRPVEHPLWGRGKRFICRVRIYPARHVVAPTQLRWRCPSYLGRGDPCGRPRGINIRRGEGGWDGLGGP
jgi:hypothetical protein